MTIFTCGRSAVPLSPREGGTTALCTRRHSAGPRRKPTRVLSSAVRFRSRAYGADEYGGRQLTAAQDTGVEHEMDGRSGTARSPHSRAVGAKDERGVALAEALDVEKHEMGGGTGLSTETVRTGLPPAGRDLTSASRTTMTEAPWAPGAG